MDAINSQIGQTFAVTSLANGEASTRVPANDTRELEQGTEANPSSVNVGNTPLQEQPSQAQDNSATADIERGEQQSDRETVEQASREIEQFLQSQNRNLSFSVDQNTQRSVVTVTEADSGDVIRQIPSDEVLRLAERLREFQTDVGSSVGVLFNNQV
ncbi:flagellar protein FlaG [Alteromonas facilis]|uniref:flagellar protein FlaG n=1 Tax=Alteromonas facilis TaxID=2048004 RepID=UPI000C288923|nr:flagellar protein FlaG [Alteromonas facilis]